MFKKVSVFAIFCFFLVLNCYGQSKTIKNIWAFAKPILQGIVIKETFNDVEKRDTAFFLYVETASSSQPRITSLAYNGKEFSPAVYPETGDELIVGIDQANGKKIRLKKGQNSFLWRIELSSSEKERFIKTKSGKISLKGKAGTQNFSFSLKPVRLQGDDAP